MLEVERRGIANRGKLALLDSSRLLAMENPELAAELSIIPADKPQEELEEFLLSA